MILNKKTNVIFLILIISVCILILLCGNINMKNMKKYKWRPIASAPALYPSDIHIGYMRYGKHSALAMPPVSHGLGNATAIMALNEDRFELPTGLDIVWLSWAEKKFYEAEVDFPVDKIVELFQEGYLNYDGEKNTYKEVNVGLIPGGRIVLYLSGNNRCIMVSQFQGVETTVDMKDYLPYAYFAYKDYNEFFDAIYSNKDAWIANYKKHGIPYQLWDKYFERFDYNIRFLFENEESIHADANYKFCNAERCIMSPFSPDVSINPAARIHTIMTGWLIGKYYYSAWFYFNEQEVLSIFDEAFNGNPIQKGELLVKVSKYNNSYDISLTVGEKSFNFEKTQIRVFKELADQEKSDAELIYKNYEGASDTFLGE